MMMTTTFFLIINEEVEDSEEEERTRCEKWDGFVFFVCLSMWWIPQYCIIYKCCNLKIIITFKWAFNYFIYFYNPSFFQLLLIRSGLCVWPGLPACFSYIFLFTISLTLTLTLSIYLSTFSYLSTTQTPPPPNNVHFTYCYH